MISAKHSFSYVDKACALGPKTLLRYATGWPSCMSTAPIPSAEASVSIVKLFEKLGKARTGAVMRAFFNAEKLS